ncbi:hypothetical protein [Sphingomonas quercus]|uniref:Uncharacterized protein n=1 Tax=Sphingomonas quercus TaxID=2842451 RepID=A0ABS6BJR3_9SPHN|nr:hypothetical protein [Sphingomonas quercus]MBU3077676.1 hypothetical protein [Sphingomonas quercus]
MSTSASWPSSSGAPGGAEQRHQSTIGQGIEAVFDRRRHRIVAYVPPGRGAPIEAPKGRPIIAVTGAFAPYQIQLDDGACFVLESSRASRSYKAGPAARMPCQPAIPFEPVTPVPPRADMRLIGTAWGFAAWRDDRTGGTVVTDMRAGGQPILFETQMAAVGIRGMRAIDAPGAMISLVGRYDGHDAVILFDLYI